MKVVHRAQHVIQQQLIVRRRGSFGHVRHSGVVQDFRARQSRAFSSVFGHSSALRVHRGFRPEAELTPQQLWQVYRMCGDLRAAVDSIARRVSTHGWRVLPKAATAADPEEYRRALQQAAHVNAGLAKPNEDDDWREMIEKLVRDALVYWHGVIESAYDRVATHTAAGVTVDRGQIREFVPVYAPDVHPIPDESGRIIGYAQVADGFRGDPSGLTLLAKDQISRLVLQPNTASPYAVPIIETVVREVTTIVRGSERAMYTMDRSEVPPGFLVLTGMAPKIGNEVREAAEHYKGNDHKLRIIHSHGATSPAQWLRTQETFKEIEFQPVISQAQKVIWRNFGVTPIEMGDVSDSNRASSTAELEVGDSHLVEPLLDALTQLVQSRMIPPLVDRFERERHSPVLVEFEFAEDEGQTPDDDKTDAEAAAIRLKSGQTTINEERVAEGRPRVKGGDVVRVDGMPIDGGEVIGDVDEQDAKAQADAEVEAAEEDRGACGPRCRHGATPHEVAVLLSAEWAAAAQSRKLARRAANDLPSDWQPSGRFRGQRVMDLQQLFDQVVRYRRQVSPFWREAQREVLAITGSSWRAGTIGNSEYLRRVGEAMEALRTEWSTVTRARYLDAAEIGAEGARSATGSAQAGLDAEERATVYYEQAMAYLDALISDVQTRVVANVQAVRSGYAFRAPQHADPGLGPDAELDDLLEAIDGAFGANEHRIDNWSGRLVELANLTMLGAILASGGADDTGEPADTSEPGEAPQATQWWVSWEYVGDERMCETCENEGDKGIRPASALNTVPGGETECRARCRCVLVYWTRGEVDSGVAVKINP